MHWLSNNVMLFDEFLFLIAHHPLFLSRFLSRDLILSDWKLPYYAYELMFSLCRIMN